MKRRRVNHKFVCALATAEIEACEACTQDTRSLVTDILHDLGVPEAFHSYSCRDLTCPNCEKQLDQTTWVRRCEEGFRLDAHFVAKSIFKYGKSLRQFHEFLSLFPYLGLDHPVGKLINRGISRFPALNIRSKLWVRAQKIEDISQLTPQRMLPPDPTKYPIPQGRFNHEGQCVLYVSEDIETAIAELFDRPGDKKHGLCGIQTFNIFSLSKVLDLRGASSPSLLYAAIVFDKYLDRSVDHNSSWKPEYLVPRFVADIARRRGFDGIIYRTSKIFCATGLNLVVFYPSSKNYKPLHNPNPYQRTIRRTPLGLGGFDIVHYEIESV